MQVGLGAILSDPISAGITVGRNCRFGTSLILGGLATIVAGLIVSGRKTQHN